MGKKINIKIEEFVQLEGQGMSYQEIANYFTEKGKKISRATVSNRLKEYYEAQGISKEKPKNKIDVDIAEIVQLNMQGMSYEEIANYFTENGKKIGRTTVYTRLKEYYKLHDKKPKLPRKKRIDIDIE